MDSEQIRALLIALPNRSFISKPPNHKAVLFVDVEREQDADIAEVEQWVTAAGGFTDQSDPDEMRTNRGIHYLPRASYFVIPNSALKTRGGT